MRFPNTKKDHVQLSAQWNAKGPALSPAITADGSIEIVALERHATPSLRPVEFIADTQRESCFENVKGFYGVRICEFGSMLEFYETVYKE
jgi:hypothetical protein